MTRQSFEFLSEKVRYFFKVFNMKVFLQLRSCFLVFVEVKYRQLVVFYIRLGAPESPPQNRANISGQVKSPKPESPLGPTCLNKSRQVKSPKSESPPQQGQYISKITTLVYTSYSRSRFFEAWVYTRVYIYNIYTYITTITQGSITSLDKSKVQNHGTFAYFLFIFQKKRGGRLLLLPV